jgi:hypothetical protein
VSLAFATVVLASTAALGGVSNAGVAVLNNKLTIVKTVTGEVPDGTTFTASVNCTAAIIDGGGVPTTSATVDFDSDGQPTSPDVIKFLAALGSCTVTETADGDATATTYACEGIVTITPAVESDAVAPICPAAGPQAAPITVNKSYPGISATVTINNTFAAPTPTTTTTPQSSPAASPAILARPTFTG